MTDAAFFPYGIDWRLSPFWLPFGVKPSHDGVHVDRDQNRLLATFGFVKVETSLDNVSGGHITRDYRWYTAAGARLSMVDDGLTFGTNREAGVCLHFTTPVKHRLSRKPCSALTVTVADPEALVTAVGEAEPRA
jgi:hypothetical protein